MLNYFKTLIQIFRNFFRYVKLQKHPLEVFYKNDVLENFSKFSGKHLCYADACNFIKKETLAQVFSYEFWEIFN